MRTFCIIAISFIISLPLAGQTKLDKIVYQNGKEIEVFIVRNLDETIECTYPGEEMVTVIPKSKLEKIIFRSGREEIINTLTSSETSIYELKEFDRMRQIKAHRAIGFAGSTFALKKSMKGVETIPVSIILSSAVKDRLSNENVFLEQAIRIFVEKAKIGKTGFTPKTDDSASLYAVFSILSADDDGEIYGILDFYHKDSETPICSKYMNGNGYKDAISFDNRVLGGVDNAIRFLKK